MISNLLLSDIAAITMAEGRRVLYAAVHRQGQIIGIRLGSPEFEFTFADGLDNLRSLKADETRG